MVARKKKAQCLKVDLGHRRVGLVAGVDDARVVITAADVAVLLGAVVDGDAIAAVGVDILVESLDLEEVVVAARVRSTAVTPENSPAAESKKKPHNMRLGL